MPSDPIRRKQLQRLYNRGLKMRVDNTRFRVRVTALREVFGLSYQEIANRSGVPFSTITNQIWDPTRKTISRDVVRKVMAVQITIDDAPILSAEDRMRGALRLIHGLQALGFDYAAMGEAFGIPAGSLPNLTSERIRAYPAPSMELYNRIVIGAQKLEACDPLDVGVSLKSKVCNIGRARKRGYPPATAWDADTVHREDVEPEWTGACGTLKGYHLHYREGIVPICDRCRAAKAVYNAERRAGLHDRDAAAVIRDMAIDELMDEGKSRAEVCALLSISLKTVERRVKARNGGQ